MRYMGNGLWDASSPLDRREAAQRAKDASPEAMLKFWQAERAAHAQVEPMVVEWGSAWLDMEILLYREVQRLEAEVAWLDFMAHS